MRVLKKRFRNYMVTFVAKVVNIFQHPNNGVHLNWMLHDRCTFDCSYCPPSNKAGIDSWLKEDKVYELLVLKKKLSEEEEFPEISYRRTVWRHHYDSE